RDDAGAERHGGTDEHRNPRERAAERQAALENDGAQNRRHGHEHRELEGAPGTHAEPERDGDRRAAAGEPGQDREALSHAEQQRAGERRLLAIALQGEMREQERAGGSEEAEADGERTLGPALDRLAKEEANGRGRN